MYKMFLFIVITFFSCSSPQQLLQRVDFSSSSFKAGPLTQKNTEVLNRIIYFAQQDIKAGKTAVIIANGNCRDKQSGTGNTLTAKLLDKISGRDVYRIDLSQVVNKYIGETEKNLQQELEKAASKKYILWFDEADALFGKRTNVRNARDRYTNIDIDYLLHSIEIHHPLAVLISNYKAKPDKKLRSRFNLWMDLDCETE